MTFSMSLYSHFCVVPRRFLRKQRPSTSTSYERRPRERVQRPKINFCSTGKLMRPQPAEEEVSLSLGCIAYIAIACLPLAPSLLSLDHGMTEGVLQMSAGATTH